ncbi:MAG TPA: flagellar basal body L-ring protein FlgH [Bryobacteraceae bacterium]|nr:flagellar basal body L-ring protein FlgH [Bryobacteraceae bacterium]
MRTCIVLLAIAMAAQASVRPKKLAKAQEPTALDRYIEEALRGATAGTAAQSGSIWSPGAPLVDLTRELRASRVDDVVTILVAESASAVSKGATKSARAANASAAINALGGTVKAGGPWANLANLSGKNALDGSATTSRDMTLTTTLTARVTHVLPNGFLVVEGSKDIQVNSEHQQVVVRGVVRPTDLSPANVVRSDHIGQMEIRLNGKGVVGDAIRRPFILYRLLLGLLPF